MPTFNPREVKSFPGDVADPTLLVTDGTAELLVGPGYGTERMIQVILRGTELSIVGSTNGGSLDLLSMPACSFKPLGYAFRCNRVLFGSGGIADTADLDLSVGSVADADGTLDTTGVNIIPKLDMATAVGGVSAGLAAESAADLGAIDFTAGTGKAILNAAVTAASDDTIKVWATIQILARMIPDGAALPAAYVA